MSSGKPSDPLHRRVILAAQGFTLTLTLRAPGRGSTKRNLYFFADAHLEATLPRGAYVVFGDLSGLLPDCLRLCDWIEEHIEHLAARHAANQEVLNAPLHMQRTWVPLELGLQITCLEGEVWRDGEMLSGSFALRVMVDAGRDPAGHTLSAGLEGIIEVNDAVAFAEAMRGYVADVYALYEH